MLLETEEGGQEKMGDHQELLYRCSVSPEGDLGQEQNVGLAWAIERTSWLWRGNQTGG